MLRSCIWAGLALASGTFTLAASPPRTADLVLYDGKVLSVDRTFSIKQAVIVRDGRILAVGSNELARTFNAPRKIDLHGGVLMPGFMDTHLHIDRSAVRGGSRHGAK